MNNTFKKVAAVAAAAVASACMALSVSAYLDYGDTVSYTVASGAKTWNNKNDLAWNINSAKDSFYRASVTSGCKGKYYFMRWTTGSDTPIIDGLEKSADFKIYISSATLPTDDYYAKVVYVSGGVNNGTIQIGS